MFYMSLPKKELIYLEKETIVKFSELAKIKADFLRISPFRYFIYSMLAGIYVGLGIILIFSIGAPLKEANVPKTIDFGVNLKSHIR